MTRDFKNRFCYGPRCNKKLTNVDSNNIIVEESIWYCSGECQTERRIKLKKWVKKGVYVSKEENEQAILSASDDGRPLIIP